MAMNGEVLEYKEVFLENRGAMLDGRLQFLNEKMVFKNNKTGKVDTIPRNELLSAAWRRVARDHELKLGLRSGQTFKFDGFKEQELDRLQNFLEKKYGLNIQQQELSGKGWNWGKTEFEGSEMRFEVGSKSSFEIPLSNVSQCSLARDEVTLEFHQNDDSELSLMEMRFYIPPSQDDDIDRVKEFHDNVMAKADVLQIKGKAICTFQDMQCLTPRGRYDIRMYPKFIQLHGKTFDYKITYTSVLRLFLLPHKDQRQIFFVVSLNPPLKQGQTRYHFLILLFFKEDELSVEFSLSEEEMQERFEGKLEREMSGPMYEIVSRVMKHLVQRKITVPGTFRGLNGVQSITCAYKASSGFLFPLERGFMYVHKPPIHVRFDEIAYVNFARGKANINRFFDFEIETRSKTTYIFSNIERDQYSALYDFVSGKKLKIKNIGKDGMNYDTMEGSDEEGESDVHDPYLARMKQEAADRDEGGDDSDESEDEDFKPDEQENEVAEEYDSNPESSEDEVEDEEGEGSEDMSEEEKPKRKRKASKERKPRKEKEKKEGGKRKRQKKDPNAPKRPASAYMMWLNDNRSRIKEEHPGISITELSKLAGKEWNSIGASVKEKYEKRYEVKREEYQVAYSEYKKSGGGVPARVATPTKKSHSGGGKSRTGGSTVSPAKFKSKEFITESDSMSSSDSDADKKVAKKSKAKSESESEAEMTPGSSDEAEESGSD